MNIGFPKQVKSDYNGYNNFIELTRIIRESTESDFKLLFQHTEVFEANLAAILGAIIDSYSEQKKDISCENISASINEALKLNNFIKDDSFDQDVLRKDAIISYMKFTPYKDIEFMDYVRNDMLSKPTFPKHSKLLGKKITESIFELFENARTHGNCKHIYTCGHIIKDTTTTRLDFTIVDMGNTIKSNVNEYLNTNYPGHDAIEWAMKSGHTTKTGNVSGGLGLEIIFEFIKLNKGRIQIVSSDGYLEYFNNNIEKRSFTNYFPGTIANIEFNLDDRSSYLLKEEISLTDIF